MKLILVRHGQTEDNIRNVIQKPETPLNAVGKKQAIAIAKKLKNEKIDMVFSSDYKRALDTAKEIVKFHPDLEIIHSQEIREKNAGIFTGKPLTKQQDARIRSGMSFYKFRPTNGESLTDLQKRMVRFYKRLTRKYKKKTILLVTHGGAIKTLLLYLEDKNFENSPDIHIKNTDRIIIELKNGKTIIQYPV